MKRIVFDLTLAIVLTLAGIGTGIANDKRPDIIVIMADDLDSDQLSCYGGQNIHTKHIDALAQQGLKFNQMIASEAMCVPTRASLFTGLYPARHGAYRNHKPVYDNLKSVVHFLNDAGYKVGLTGKDHVTTPKSIFPFEIIEGFETDCVAHTDEYHLDSIRRFIDKGDAPYCLFVMSVNPHIPWTVGDPSEFDASKLKLPPHWVDTELTREQFTRYLAEVRRLDNQVGDVVNLLKETGQEDNTVVIFLGEQGPQFPGGKWTLWDNGVRSSMIVKWPGSVNPNTETDAIVQYEDIAPTLVDIAGGCSPKGLDGMSLLDVIRGRRSSHRDYAYGIHNNIPEGPAYPIRSIRSDRYKLVLNLTPEKDYYIKYMMRPDDKEGAYATWLKKAEKDTDARFLTSRIAKRPALEFYDLKEDPYELNNLSGNPAYDSLINVMRTELEKWMEQQGDTGVDLDLVAFNQNFESSVGQTYMAQCTDPTSGLDSKEYLRMSNNQLSILKYNATDSARLLYPFSMEALTLRIAPVASANGSVCF